MTKEKLRWLINYWKTAAERSEAVATKVSGEGEAAEIQRTAPNKALPGAFPHHPLIRRL